MHASIQGDDVDQKAKVELSKLRDARQRRVAIVQRAGQDMKTAFSGMSRDAAGVQEALAMIDKVVAVAIVAVSQH